MHAHTIERLATVAGDYPSNGYTVAASRVELAGMVNEFLQFNQQQPLLGWLATLVTWRRTKEANLCLPMMSPHGSWHARRDRGRAHGTLGFSGEKTDLRDARLRDKSWAMVKLIPSSSACWWRAHGKYFHRSRASGDADESLLRHAEGCARRGACGLPAGNTQTSQMTDSAIEVRMSATAGTTKAAAQGRPSGCRDNGSEEEA